ncbi:MAG: alpha-ketoacid dehydrogenase subunit beta, partial [Oscillospiraceae bacterium]|nr:alpha-ketoacid dehydrogenase subunit beta [Oscillospiraceae bacterium]
VRKGSDATVVVFAEMLDPVLEACSDLNVNILYYSTVCPFDIRTLQENLTGDKLILCHPFYEGTFADDIINIVSQGVALCEISVPRIILRNYGTKTEKDIHLGLDPASIKTKIKKFLEE